jgi:type II secretory pathway pseudopilin PulG
MMRRDSRGGDRMERGGDRRGGSGIGTGIGIGIGVGVGQEIIRQSAPPPTETRPAVTSTKKTTKSKKAAKKPPPKENATTTTERRPALRYYGKPDEIPHNPQLKDGKLGDLSDHKQVTVSKDGSYYTRHYYYTREGNDRTWYYYDVLIDPKSPVISQLKDVPQCQDNDDNCDGPKVPGTIEVDNKLPPEVSALYEEPCKEGKFSAGRAYSICVAGANGKGTWHVRSDDEYICKDDVRKTYRTVDIDTEQPCEGGRPTTVGVAMPVDNKADCTPLQVTNPIQYYEDWECVGHAWRVTRYDIKVCTPPDGRRFIGQRSTIVPNPDTNAGECNPEDKSQRPPIKEPEKKADDKNKT